MNEFDEGFLDADIEVRYNVTGSANSFEAEKYLGTFCLSNAKETYNNRYAGFYLATSMPRRFYFRKNQRKIRILVFLDLLPVHT
jgi:hypothetical protein